MKKNPDLFLIFLTFIFVIVGLIMVFSSSSATCAMLEECHNDPFFYFKGQLKYAIIGTVCFVAASMIDIKLIGKYSLIGMFISFLLLLAVLIPGIGISAMGASRWLGFGSFSFQPAELAKVVSIIYLADFLARKGAKILETKTFWLLAGVFLVMAALIEAEPDLGTALSIMSAFFVMLYIGGARLKDVATLLSGCFCVIVLKLMTGHSYRINRMISFLDPWKDAQGIGYHVCQSLIAVGSGGIWGLGIGGSRQKFFYLPEQYTDFIFAIFAEEMGLIGSLILVAMFIVLLYKGFKLATQTGNLFMRLLAAGITFLLAFQGFMNMGVVVGLLPCTGIPLPFISYGGSSLIASMTMAGLLVNISGYSSRRHSTWQWGEDEDELDEPETVA